MHEFNVVLQEGGCDYESVVDCKQYVNHLCKKNQKKSQFIVGCISDMSKTVYMKILTFVYVPCHFMIFLGKDPKFLLVLGSEMS